MEKVFIQVAEGKDHKSLIPTIYQMTTKENQLLQSFLEARSKGLLFNRTSVNKDGKSTIFDPDTNRPVNLYMQG